MSAFKINHLSAKPTKWSNRLKQLVESLSMNCLNVFDDFVKFGLKGFIMKASEVKTSMIKLLVKIIND